MELDYMYQKGCPPRPTETNCGLRALTWLIAGRAISILDENGRENGVNIDFGAKRVFEVISTGEPTDERTFPAAKFDCIGCGKCVVFETAPYNVPDAGIVREEK